MPNPKGRPVPRYAPPLCHRLKHRRLALGLSRQALAQQAAVPVQLIVRLEHAMQHWTHPDRLQALAGALGCTATWLNGSDEEEVPQPSPSRRYRRPVSVAETANRILRSLDEHRAQGIRRTIDEYVQSREVADAVYALLQRKEHPGG